MLKIIHRSILQELLEYFLLALFLFTFVLFLNKILHLTELIINKGVPLRTVAHLLALITPSFLIITIPMALLVACIMVFSRLSSDSEIVSLRASGVSFYNLLLPVALLSFGSWALSSSIMLYALPWTHQGLQTMKYELIRSQAAGFEVKERVFNDSFEGLVLYVN
ncbi:MAG: LptF/LptG family permease, partial [Nitrospinota bacterium]